MAGVIAHEWIEEYGGAERVLDAFVELFPTAPIYCLWTDAPERYPGSVVLESPLARTPLRGRKAAALPLMSRQWRNVDLELYDWALISSYAFAHHLGSGVKGNSLRRFVYVHTPARYVWAPEYDPNGRTLPARLTRPFFRRQDRRHMDPDADFAANSEFVRDRTRRAWGVEPRVIYPPVDVAAIQNSASWRPNLTAEDEAVLASLPEQFLLGASRFVDYKRLHDVMDFGASVGMPVVIAGSGPLEQRLRSHAVSLAIRVDFVVRPSDALLRSLYQAAAAFVYPPVEDFGIMPVEATALGTPVIVNREGGASESSRITGGGVCCSFVGDRRENVRALAESQSLSMGDAMSASRIFSREAFQTAVLEWTSTAHQHPT